MTFLIGPGKVELGTFEFDPLLLGSFVFITFEFTTFVFVTFVFGTLAIGTFVFVTLLHLLCVLFWWAKANLFLKNVSNGHNVVEKTKPQ